MFALSCDHSKNENASARYTKLVLALMTDKNDDNRRWWELMVATYSMTSYTPSPLHIYVL